MPSLGPAEILVILVVALLVFGPNKMPDIARQVGKGMRELRRVQESLSHEFHDVVSEFQGEDTAPTPAGDAAPTLPPRTAVSNGEAASAPKGPDEPPTEPKRRGDRVWPPSAGDSS